MKLLVDHNLPPRLASALHIIFEPHHEIVALREKFGRSDLTDEEWIVRLGREGGWAVLSKDMNIAKKKPSRDLFIGAGLVGFLNPSCRAGTRQQPNSLRHKAPEGAVARVRERVH